MSSLPTASGNSSDSNSSAGGLRPRTRRFEPPLARPQARRPSGPSRSATAPPGSPASSPSRLTPSSFSSSCRCAPSASRSIGSGARNSRVRSSETTSTWPERATFAAASAVNFRAAAPTRASHPAPAALQRPLQRRLEAAVEPLDPARLEVRAARRGRRRPRSPRPRASARFPPTPPRLRRDRDRRAGATGTFPAPPPAAFPASRPRSRRQRSPARAAPPPPAPARARPARAAAEAAPATRRAARTRG